MSAAIDLSSLTKAGMSIWVILFLLMFVGSHVDNIGWEVRCTGGKSTIGGTSSTGGYTAVGGASHSGGFTASGGMSTTGGRSQGTGGSLVFTGGYHGLVVTRI